MRILRIFLVLACVVPFAFSANKDMIELQRDVAELQMKVDQLNDKLTALTANLQVLLNNSGQTNAAIVSMQQRTDENIKRQQEVIAAPVAAVGTKLDQMADDFRNMRETVLDMNSRIGKLDQKVVDLQNLMNVIKSQPAPPPPTQGGDLGAATPAMGMPAGAGGISTTGPPPGMQAETSYTNAYRDYGAGNYDLALQELKDYVRYFPQTQLAPNAQYYIGDIYYRRKDYDNAITAFDAVLEHFSDNNKTPDAHLMKGRSLLAENKRDAAAREFKEIIAKYPDSDAAAKAKSLLKELGLSSSSAKKKHR
jgi:tol-pal system protein YbgF